MTTYEIRACWYDDTRSPGAGFVTSFPLSAIPSGLVPEFYGVYRTHDDGRQEWVIDLDTIQKASKALIILEARAEERARNQGKHLL